MTRYKFVPEMQYMVTDPEGQYVPFEQAEAVERENAILRREVEKYKLFNALMIKDECELEVELEKLGLVFYDEYGHLGTAEVITKYVKDLQSQLKEEL